ncbi:hypothetical protein ACLB2K_043915 [Fragaria x ananassa]
MGQAIGVFVKAVRGCSNPCLGEFLKIRVGIDLSKPLRKWVSFRPVGWPESGRFDIEYERLPHFCFFCGMLGHTGGKCSRREARELKAPTYDALIHADKKEEWLTNQLRIKEKEREQLSSTGGWRFGLHPKKQTGWIMTVPELQTVGFVRSRSELEMDKGDPREGENDMEVDSCQEHSDFDTRGGKRRIFGDAGASRSPETVKEGITHAESTTLINSHFQREKSRRVFSLDTEGGVMSQALIVPHLDKEEKEKFQEVAKESILSIPDVSDFVPYGVIGGTLDGQSSKVLASKDGIKELGRFFRDSFKSAEAGNPSTITNCALIEFGPNPSFTGQAQIECHWGFEI